MRKIVSLVISISFMFISTYAYLYIDYKINDGEKQLTTGEKEYTQGQEALKKGKVELATGKQKLSQGKHIYQGINIIPFVGVAKVVPIVNMPFKHAKKSISRGDKQVASGQAQVSSGERRLAEGKKELERGQAQLITAKKIREYLGWTTAFFTLLSLVIIFFWQRIPRKII